MKKAVSKTDIIIYIAVALAAVISLASVTFFTDKGAAQNVCVRTVKGESTYSISQDKTFDIESNGISLTVEIADGAVRVKKATCPDKCCENMGRISKPGESIVCLPAHVTLTLTGGEGQYDANAG